MIFLVKYDFEMSLSDILAMNLLISFIADKMNWAISSSGSLSEYPKYLFVSEIIFSLFLSNISNGISNQITSLLQFYSLIT